MTVVASFDRPAEAREAMLELEAHGFDADDIRLAQPAEATVPTPAAERDSDAAMFKSVGRRAAVWGPVGALVGAALVIAGLAIFGALNTTSVIVALLVGGIFGFYLGAIWGGSYKLPVNEDAIDTLAVDPRDSEPVTVEVRVHDDGQAEEATRLHRATTRPSRSSALPERPVLGLELVTGALGSIARGRTGLWSSCRRW